MQGVETLNKAAGVQLLCASAWACCWIQSLANMEKFSGVVLQAYLFPQDGENGYVVQWLVQ